MSDVSTCADCVRLHAEVERLTADLAMLRAVAAARLEDYRQAEVALARVRTALWDFAENLRLMRQYDSLSAQNQSTTVVEGYALWERYGALLWDIARERAALEGRG